jgi:diguanylate cyclase (GGDEF)-like protein
LVAAQGENVQDISLNGLGVNLNEAEEGFRVVQLREPLRIPAFVEMVKEVFSVEEFFAWQVDALGEVQGVVCFMAPAPTDASLAILLDWRALLTKAITLVESERRLHVVTVKDMHTDLFNRQTFITKLTDEISRARRTNMAVSLVVIAVDQFGQLTSLFGQEEAQLMLKTAARIIEKHSRTNDIIGRTGVDEFALLLPHTSKEGALIKAERLRKIIEGADFSKTLRQFPRLTISLGVSEYPSLVRDAEELLQSADEALYQIRTVGNKTGVGTKPEGFEADFIVPDEKDT